MKIAVCVPHTGWLKAQTAQCLGVMLAATAGANITYNGAPARADIDLLFSDIGPLDLKRTQLALAALESGSDYLLWIDSDQVFERDALLRLMGHDKPIIGANYPSRHTGQPTAVDVHGETLPRRHGVEEVAAIGLGFCLIKTPILELVPQPWFAGKITPDGHLICGEDVHFCNQARAANVPVFVDHDLEVGHLAERVLRLGREGANAGSNLPTSGPE